MRGKRSKQYRKLMHQYGVHFGFREPYQVLLDAAILQDAKRFKMDFAGGIQKALHGQVKPMITQCCIRHLYEAEPKDEELINHAKAFERRRCNHHTLEKPLSPLECLSSVVDPKANKTNKFRYVIASQDEKVRAYMRTVPGVPLVYIKRSVLIMEPMAGATALVAEREESEKFRAGIRAGRKQDSDFQSRLASTGAGDEDGAAALLPRAASSKRKRGPTEPNPLSVKKPRKKAAAAPQADDNPSDGLKRKRRRRHKSRETPPVANAAP